METHQQIQYPLSSVPSLTSELTLESPPSASHYLSPEGVLYPQQRAYVVSALQSPDVRSPPTRRLGGLDSNSIDLNHMLDRQMLDVKYLKLELETLQREKGQLERDNLQLRKRTEELELQTHQVVEVVRRDERASLLAELRLERSKFVSQKLDTDTFSVEPIPTQSLHRLALDEVDKSHTELLPTSATATSPSFLVVPSASNSSKFKGTPAPRTGKVLPRGVAGIRKDPPLTPTPARKSVPRATRDVHSDIKRPSYSQVPRIKVDSRVLQRRPIPSFLPTSSEDGTSIRPTNTHTKVDSESNPRTSNSNDRPTITTEHAPTLEGTRSAESRVSLSQHGYRPSSNISVLRSPTESSSTGLRHALSTSNRYTAAWLPAHPETNAKINLQNPADSPVWRARNLRSALGITESTKMSNETRPSRLENDYIFQSQVHGASTNPSSSSHTSTSSPTILSPSLSSQAVAGDSQYNLSLSSTNATHPLVDMGSSETQIPSVNCSDQPSSPPLPYETTQSKYVPRGRNADSASSHPQNVTSATLSNTSSFAKKSGCELGRGDTFAPTSGYRHSILGVRPHGRDAPNRSPPQMDSEHKEYHLDEWGLSAGASLSQKSLSEVRRPSSAVDRQPLTTGENTSMSARVPLMTSPVPRPRPQMRSNLRFPGNRSALDNRSSQLESFSDHRKSLPESQTAVYVSAPRFDSCTNYNSHFNSTPPGQVSTIVLPELRPADSVSQLGDLPESTPEYAQLEDNGTPGTGSSSFSISSSFNGTHLPDLPPLPSIASSPALSNDAKDSINKRFNRVSLSRIPRRVSTEAEPEPSELNHDAARLRQAVEIEKSELISRGYFRDAAAPGAAPLRRSWGEEIIAQGGFDPVARRLLSTVEYHKLVDDIVLFDRDLISPQVLLARAQHIFLAPERTDTLDTLLSERLDAFRYLATLMREHTEENGHLAPWINEQI